MDSTISVQPGEAPDSLHRARRAAWVVLPARWSTGTIFFSMALPPRWCSTANFSRKSARRWERLPPLPPSALGFFFARSAELFWPLRRSPRAETDADDDRLDDGYRHCLHRPAPLVQPDRLVGAGAAGVPASGSGIRRRRRMGRRGAALGGECPQGKKPFTAAGCRWATASASCSLPGWYR